MGWHQHNRHSREFWFREDKSRCRDCLFIEPAMGCYPVYGKWAIDAFDVRPSNIIVGFILQSPDPWATYLSAQQWVWLWLAKLDWLWHIGRPVERPEGRVRPCFLLKNMSTLTYSKADDQIYPSTPLRSIVAKRRRRPSTLPVYWY